MSKIGSTVIETKISLTEDPILPNIVIPTPLGKKFKSFRIIPNKIFNENANISILIDGVSLLSTSGTFAKFRGIESKNKIDADLTKDLEIYIWNNVDTKQLDFVYEVEYEDAKRL